ncbi:MAG: hypothetical protein JWP13_281 [Candidatus Saccharibacteria bacterium]|nr:hypothetical protein [Candidatus Saccharibacteria bacterium]
MWDLLTVKRKNKKSGLTREYDYASHHHLIPLYILSGVSILTLLVMGCYVSILWQANQRESLRSTANLSVEAVENIYIPTVVSAAEKKQYVYPSNVRFGLSGPYDTLRYEYDPGMTPSKTSSALSFTTSRVLATLAKPINSNPNRASDYISRLQQCARLYIVRFEPGLPPNGGFASLKDIKLKDGRTAYVHKNIACVPTSPQAMTELENIEKDILSVESY